MIKRITYLILILLSQNWGLSAQESGKLSLSEAYQLLENRYPALKNGALSDQIYSKELESIDKEKMPSVFVKADTRFQSESVSLDAGEGVMLPFEIDQPLVSAKAYLEANYTILDGGLIDLKKKLKAVELAAEKQNVEVERYTLRERVNALFLNITLLRSQQKLFDISLKDLEDRRTVLTAGVENGVVLESELTKLEVKKLELISGKTDLEFKQIGLHRTLEDLIGIAIDENIEFVFPALPEFQNILPLNRPEQTLFQLKKEAVLAKSEMLEVSKKPMLGAFAQAGVGYPNPLNLLDNSAAPYGLIGAQFRWKITDWKKSALDKEILTLQAQKLQIAEETFNFNMNSKKANYLAEIERLKKQIEQDEKIADLQAKVLAQLAVQLDEGVITSNDYVSQVNAELRSRQKLLVHQKELLKTQLEFFNERGADW